MAVASSLSTIPPVTIERVRGPGSKGETKKSIIFGFNANFRIVPGGIKHKDDDVYYRRGRRPREDEQEEESYEKQRQRP